MMLSSVKGTDVAVDPGGNIYATGVIYATEDFNAWVDFDPGPNESWVGTAGQQEGFLAKYGPDKSLQWVQRVTGTGGCSLRDVALGIDGNVYVAGGFDGEATFGTQSFSSTFGNSAGFVAKLSPEGNVEWARQFGDGDSSSFGILVRRIALDDQGNVYANGLFQDGTDDFEPGDGVTELTAQGQDSYVVQFKADGTFGWATNLGTSGSIWTYALAADSTGVYTGGRFSGTMRPGLTDTGEYNDGFLVKLSAVDGSPLWAKQYTDVPIGCLASDGTSVYAAAGDDRFNSTGISTGREFIAKYDTDGGPEWSNAWPGVVAYDITVQGGALYLTGTFGAYGATVDFNPDSAAQFNLTAVGTADAYVAKLTDLGEFLWAGQMGGPAAGFVPNERGTGVAVDGGGNVVTVGNFFQNGGPADFDPGTGAATMNALGNADAFVSKLKPSGSGLQYDWAFQLGSYEKYLDDGQAGYQESGSGWKSGKPGGYTGDWRYHSKGSGANKAQWTFTGLAAGQYDVYATWVADSRNATNAQYVINGIPAPLVNQRVTPDDVPASPGQVTPDGVAAPNLERLGTYTADSLGKITVVLSDKANGNVVADAIRLVAVPPPPPAAPSVSINDVSASEGSGGTTTFQFTVSLSAAVTSLVTVNYVTQAGMATEGVDYLLASGALTFNPGDPLTQQISVAVNGDTTKESNETFFVDLTLASGDVTLAKGQGTGTIVNDDGGKPGKASTVPTATSTAVPTTEDATLLRILASDWATRPKKDTKLTDLALVEMTL